MNPFGPAGEALAGARRVAFVTGAGVSQESGIPTFRGDGGLWRSHDPAVLATIDAFRGDPALVWEWYRDRRRNILAAEPNAGHAAIAGMEGLADVAVLTQNVDGLHQRAGSTNVLELHGSIVRTRCTSCGFVTEDRGEIPGSPPLCGCGAVLRPDVVWFGEPLDRGVWGDAVDAARACDVMVVAGTSLAVSPANTLPAHARRCGATLIEINPEETEMSPHMDLSVREAGASALPRLASMFRQLRK